MKEYLSEDEATIRAIIAKQSEAWTRGDAGEWAKPFAEDVDFVVRDGTRLKGREEVARAHERFFNTFYKETKQRIKISSIRFLRDDVAVVHNEVNVAKQDEEFPSTPQFVPVLVLVKNDGRWQIVVAQNTMVQEPL